MRHFIQYISNKANFSGVLETSISNLITPKIEKEAKKYIRKKKEQSQAEKEE